MKRPVILKKEGEIHEKQFNNSGISDKSENH